MSTNLYNNKVHTLLARAGQEMNSSEWGLVYISHADEARVTSVISVQVWKKHRGDEQNFPFRNKRQYRKGRTTNFRSSDVWENCLWWWKRPMPALSHVAASHHISYAALTVCGGWGLWRDFVSSLPNRLDSFSLLFTRWAGVALPVVSFLSQSQLFLI